MTMRVTMSIHVQRENGEGKVLQIVVRSEHIEEDLREIVNQTTQAVAEAAFSDFEKGMKASQYPEGVSIRTQERCYQFQRFSIRYRRRSYRLADGRVWTPLDELLGFVPYQRRTQKAEEQISALAASLSYRDTAEVNGYVSHQSISPSTVGRVVRRIGQSLSAQEQSCQAEQPGQIKAPRLYCEADGVWVALQKEKQRKMEVRVAIAYTGKQYISGSRKRLKDKVCITSIGLPAQKWQEMIRERLYARYDLQSTKTLVIGGDGSPWVGTSFDLLGINNSIRVLDPYHVKRAISSAFGTSLPVKEVVQKLYSQGFLSIEKSLLKACVGLPDAKAKARLDCLQYLRNHADEILQGFSLGAIESNVGKLVAQRMKTRGVSWSLDGARAMLAILEHKKELFSNSFQFHTSKAMQASSKKTRAKSYRGTVHSASFPILKSGKLSAPYASLFKAIINDDLPLSS
jgi:hypothetical protein